MLLELFLLPSLCIYKNISKGEGLCTACYLILRPIYVLLYIRVDVLANRSSAQGAM